jgi:1-acyl-sn-glycerol-3-phosphate acyltransferase
VIATWVLVALTKLLSSARVVWVGVEPSERQRVYVANHSSHLDFIVLWSSLPATLRRLTRPVAGRDYWERGAIRRYLARHVFRAVLIDRPPAAGAGTDGSRVAAARAAIDQMAAALEDGSSLILFPEGTRGTGGEVAEFRAGLYHLALRRPEAEIIPVYLANLNRILPKGEVLPAPLLSRVTFGPAITIGAGEAKEPFLERVRAAVVRLRDA